MKLTILTTAETLVSFRAELEASDTVYEHEINDNCLLDDKYKNDYVVQNSTRCINELAVQLNPELERVYEDVPTFTDYFSGVELDATDPDFIAAVKLYLTEKQDMIFVG